MAGPLKNGRHERFAQGLAKGLTQIAAYREAGYTYPDETAACRLAKRPEVRARINEMLTRAAKRVEITQSRVLDELAKLGFANMADYMRAGPDGDPYLDFSSLSREQAAALTEVIVEDFKEGRGESARDVRRIKFKLADKRAALVDIGKHLGMFVEKHEHTGKDGGPIETRDLTDEEAARRIAFTLSRADKGRDRSLN